MKKFASKILKTQISRTNDPWGGGHYGASRGTRTHRGLDIRVRPNEPVYSPITGQILRKAYPYANDLSYTGVLIKGRFEWSRFEVKMFYLEPIFLGKVDAGQLIGRAQNLENKYSGITNHIHIEVTENGVHIDPYNLWGMCF